MIHATYHTNKISASPKDDLHRERNLKLHDAIDIIKLSILLKDMVETGHMHQNTAYLFLTNAETLLNLIATENNRVHGF